MKNQKFIFASVLFLILFHAAVPAEAGGQTYNGQEDPNKKIIKSGIVGAGSGALAAGATGGDAGKGALIGAGTTVIGGALLDSLTSSPPPPQTVYVTNPPQKKIIRHYNADGQVVSEEEVWQ